MIKKSKTDSKHISKWKNFVPAAIIAICGIFLSFMLYFLVLSIEEEIQQHQIGVHFDQAQSKEKIVHNLHNYLKEDASKWASLIFLIGGLLMTVFFVYYLILLMRQREMITKTVYKRTIEVYEAKKKLELIINSAGEGIFGLDLDAKFVFINDVALEMLNWKKNDIIGQDVEIINSGAAVSKLGNVRRKNELIKISLDRGEIHHVYDTCFWNKDGLAITVEFTSTPIFSEVGDIEGSVVTFKDVSKRKAFERELQNANERLQKESRTVKLLHEVAIAANEAMDVNKAMHICINHICKYMDWQIGHVIIVDEQPSEVKFDDLWYLENADIFADFKKLSNDLNLLGDGDLPKMVLDSKKPHCISDLEKNSANKRLSYAHQNGLNSALAFPIKTGNEIIAILEFFTDKNADLDENIIEIMSNIGVQISRVIERKNAEDELTLHRDNLQELVEKKTKHLVQAKEQAEASRIEVQASHLKLQKESSLIKLLHNVTVAVNNATTEEESLRLCLELICNYTWWPLAHVYECSKSEGQEIILPTEIWVGAEGHEYTNFISVTQRTHFVSGKDFVGKVFSQGEPKFSTDLSKEVSYKRKNAILKTGLKSVFMFPVKAGDEVLSILEFYSDTDTKPDKSLINTMDNICTQLGRSIERHKIERALIRTKDAAEEANRIKSEFLANISHELRTPMHAILSYSELGVSRIKTGATEKLLKFFHAINENGNRLLTLLNDLLDLSKMEGKAMDFNMEVHNLKEIVEKVSSQVWPLMQKKKLSFDITNTDDNIMAKFDEVKITQVIWNLLSNAIKFSQEGGDINISCESRSIKINNVLNEVVFFSITDSGIGIPEDELGSVFDKFIQSSKTKTGAGGTGLGLAICKDIVEAHGGEIWAESNIGGSGAVFNFFILRS